MPLHIKRSGAWATVPAGALKIKNGGTWLAVKAAWVKNGGAWRQFYQSVTAATVTHNCPSTWPLAWQSGTKTKVVTATVTGGVGPFTYAWSWASGSPATIVNATSQSCTLSRSTDTQGTFTGTLRCTVTDTGNGNATALYDAALSIDISP